MWSKKKIFWENYYCKIQSLALPWYRPCLHSVTLPIRFYKINLANVCIMLADFVGYLIFFEKCIKFRPRRGSLKDGVGGGNSCKKLNDWLWHPQVPTIGQRPKLHYKVPVASLESSIGTISPAVKLCGQQKALWKSKLAKHWPVGMHSLL